MKSKTFDRFTGLDLQSSAALSDEKTQAVASNVVLTAAGKWATRPGSKRRFSLPEETAGLYEAGGVLRAVAPGGSLAIFNQQRPNLFFDFIDSAGGPAERVIRALPYGAHVAAGVSVYAAIERNGRVEHHWFRDRPSPGGDADNRVLLPFTPGPDIARVGEKAWAINNAAGSVPFSSTEFGPSDWTTEDDAGFLPVMANAPSTRRVTALGVLQSTPGAANRRQGALAVFFRDGVQVWAVDPSPINHYLTAIIDGPGTENPQSVVNALGDPVYLSNGVFTSLRTASAVGELATMTVGHPIAPLTEGLGADAIARAVWWGRLGAYLAVEGNRWFCWRYDPLTKTRGWSVWAMPWVATDVVDYNGSLWVRTTDHEVYEVSPSFTDDNGVPIEWAVESQFHHLGQPGVVKTFNTMRLFQQGASAVSLRPEPTLPDLLQPVYAARGVTHMTGAIPLLATSDSVALRFAGTGPWQLDGYSLDYDLTGV